MQTILAPHHPRPAPPPCTRLVRAGGRPHRDAFGSGTLETVHSLADAGDIPALMRWSRRNARRLAVQTDHRPHLDPLLTALDGEPLHLLPLIEALGAMPGPRAAAALTALLAHDDPTVRAHAAWRLRGMPPTPTAVPRLVDLLTVGGITTMHAHRTLREWTATSAVPIGTTALASLDDTADAAGRARLVDLLGVLGTRDALEVVERIATDPTEPDAVRGVAIAALADRGTDHDDVLRRVAAGESPVAAAAALGLHRPTPTPDAAQPARRGLRVAQLTITGRIDRHLSLGGRGDTGGVASLLVSLGDALGQRPDVASVLTIGRGSVLDALAADPQRAAGSQSFATVPIDENERPADGAAQMWEHFPAVARGLRRALDAAGDPDVLHLRMGDVGTLAGAEIAGARRIPICFSAAADPHNVLQALHARQQLGAEEFLRLEREQHVWFRARLVERLAAGADQVAFFPRRRPDEVLDLLGLERSDLAGRTAVIGEGIDLQVRDEAERRAADGSGGGAPEAEILRDLANEIPPSRRDRPLLVSVGRLHPVKGMARVVEAWADDERVHDRFNLVIVGGDLAKPSESERGVLDEIDRILPPDDQRRAGLVLLGGRPRREVATLLASADRGHPGRWAPHGVYVDGAVKEEFGLAVLEAMAAGLTVVAPANGGPSTYVEHLRTGVLVDADERLSDALIAAADLAGDEHRRSRARATVEERYSIDATAQQLVHLYRAVEEAP